MTTTPQDNSELNELAAEAGLPEDYRIGVLDDLFSEAQQNSERKTPKKSKHLDPALRDALDHAARKMRERYTDPANWKKSRGLVLVDKETQTVLGNYSEYLHLHDHSARRLVREHLPIHIDGQEIVEGYLGHKLESELRGISWDREVCVIEHVSLDEVQVEAPLVKLQICVMLNSIVRVHLEEDTQFASASGNLILKLAAGTNVWEACGVDTKMALRKAVMA